MTSRRSSLQQYVLRVLDTAGPSSLTQLAWARAHEDEFETWDRSAGDLPTLPARQNRSAYNSVRRSVDLLVDRGDLVKELDERGHARYRRRSARHWYKTMALSSLAQAKLGPEHYRRLLDAGAAAETVFTAVCAATGWTPQKTRSAVESIAKVLKG